MRPHRLSFRNLSTNRLIPFSESDDKLDEKVLEAGAPVTYHLSGTYNESFNCGRLSDFLWPFKGVVTRSPQP